MRAAAVEVSFDRLASFCISGDSHALVLCGSSTTCTALSFVRTTSAHAQHAQGRYPPAVSRFKAHMTLRFLPWRLAAEIVTDTVTWQPREFVLIRSVICGGVHEMVERGSLSPS